MDLKNLVESKVYSRKLEEICIDRPCVINTVNPHSYCIAKKDVVFAKALLESDILLPDGIGIVLAMRIFNGNRIKKIAGADVHEYLLKKLDQANGKVFYLGASQNTLQIIEKKVKLEFPGIIVGSFSPPYKAVFSRLDSDKMLAAINNFSPDVVFVGMTAPKQEKWVDEFKKRINAKTIVSIGAVFDFYSGTVKRSGPIWIKFGLEWLPRLFREPTRLWRRTFISTPIFITDLLRAKMTGD